MPKIRPRAVLAAAALIAAAALPAASPAHAQTVRGRVVHVRTGAAIGSVDIVIMSGAGVLQAVETDSLGHFELTLPQPGTYMLVASGLGYADVPATQFTAPAGRMLDIVVRMAEDVIPLMPLEVRARAMPRNTLAGAVQRIEQNRHFGIGVHLTREEIGRSQRTELMDLIQSMSPTIRLVSARPGVTAGDGGRTYSPASTAIGEDGLAVFRSGKLCPLRVFLDGVERGVGDVAGLIHPDDLGAVEVYFGPYARGGYFDRAGCGIALLWSRDDHEPRTRRRSWLATGLLSGLLGLVVLAF